MSSQAHLWEDNLERTVCGKTRVEVVLDPQGNVTLCQECWEKSGRRPMPGGPPVYDHEPSAFCGTCGVEVEEVDGELVHAPL